MGYAIEGKARESNVRIINCGYKLRCKFTIIYNNPKKFKNQKLTKRLQLKV